MGYLAWQLWWDGFDVDIANVNKFIDEQWKYWDITTSNLIDRKSGNLKSKILNQLKNSGESRLKNKPLRQARRRVGTALFREFATTLIQLVVGRSATHGAVSDILQKGLDMVQRGYGKSPPLWLPFGIATDQLAEFSAFIRQDFANTRLVDLTDEQLLLGRDKVVRIFHFFSLMRGRTDSTKIRMGLSILEPLSHKPAFQVALLRFFIAARESTFAAQVEEFERLVKKWTTSSVS